MPILRSALFAAALLALLASAAWGQVPVPFSCTAMAAVPPLLRAEGVSELTGDIVVTCSGQPASPFSAVFQVSLNVPVTSRVINTGGATVSEALLLVDEPGTGMPGSAPLNVCTSPLAGCDGHNALPGTVAGNVVTFPALSIVPNGSVPVRVFRIANIRANAGALPPGPLGLPGQVQALLTITAPSAVPLGNAMQTVGFVQPGLMFSVRDAANAAPLGSALVFNRCVAQDRVRVATLRFAENFATVFKLRVVGAQDMPGAIYNTESGLIVPALSGPAVAGLADFGTRVKAVFANVPAGIRVFVGVQDLAAVPHMVLNATEAGPFSPVAAMQTIGGLPAAEVPVTAGTATAVYEVTAANSLMNELADIPVWISYSADVPPVTTVPVTVAGSFAPTSSATLPIPRFLPASSSVGLFGIAGCSTAVTFDSTVSEIANNLQQGLIDNAGVAQALSAQIRGAQAAAGRGQTKAAVNMLEAFQHMVRAQTGKHIDAATAARLIEDAGALIASMTL